MKKLTEDEGKNNEIFDDEGRSSNLYKNEVLKDNR